MNAGMIWWGQIGSSLRLLSNVSEHLRDCRSAVLQVPQIFPWRQNFYDALDARRASFSGERRLRRLGWDKNQSPGEYVMDELCSEKVRMEYWPLESRAKYLGSRNDIMLCDYYVWITGIHTKDELSRWAEFVTEYESCAGEPEQRAVFILEYDGPAMDTTPLPQICCRVENHDCRVFCLEAASNLANTELRTYQAELALCIGGDDPELCAQLLLTGKALLKDPVETAMEVSSTGCAFDGRGFSPLTEQAINSAAWKAAIVLLFPILEQYRLDFIVRYESELARHLPISNSNGDRVTDPYDLEIGPLSYIVSNAGSCFTVQEVEAIRLCRKARNLLAHNKPVPYADIRRVLAL